MSGLCGWLVGEGLVVLYLPFLVLYYDLLGREEWSPARQLPTWVLAGLHVASFHFGGCFLWLPSALRDYAGLGGATTGVLTFLYVALQATHGLVHGWLGTRSLKFRILRPEFVCASVWLPIREVLHWPLTVEVGDLLGGVREFVGVTSLVGTWGLTFLIHLVVGGLVASVRGRRLRCTLAVPLLGLAFLTLAGKPPTSELRTDVSLHLLQTTNRSGLAAGELEEAYDKNLRGLVEASLDEIGDGLAIVVLPEGALRRPLLFTPDGLLDRELSGSVNDWLLDAFRDAGVTAIVERSDMPIVERAEELHGEVPALTPTVFLYEKGVLVDRRTKQSLVPLVEVAPGGERFAWLRKMAWWTSARRESAEGLVFTSGGVRLGVVVCYESVFRRWFARSRAEDVDAVLVVSNDGFLGPRGGALHYRVTAARSAEFGSPTYFVGNAGFTGRVGGEALPWGVRAHVVMALESAGRSPVYVRVHPWLRSVLWCYGVGAVLIAVFGIAREVVKKYVRVGSAGRRRLGETFGGCLLAVIVVWGVSRFITVGQMRGPSMLPTLEDGDRVVVCRWQRPASGDLVLLRHRGLRQQMIKRVFLGPGESFDPEPPRRNGVPIEVGKDPAGKWLVGVGARGYSVSADDAAGLFPHDAVALGPGQYYVLGDNRSESVDSRSIGFVEDGDVVGRVCGVGGW